MLQNEWDAVVLETFALKQQFNSTRQELSYALYAQDEANRVTARFIRERDFVREYALSEYSFHIYDTDMSCYLLRALTNVQATLGVIPNNCVAEDVEMKK
jgi:pre-mRNA-processing factor 19